MPPPAERRPAIVHSTGPRRISCPGPRPPRSRARRSPTTISREPGAKDRPSFIDALERRAGPAASMPRSAIIRGVPSAPVASTGTRISRARRRRPAGSFAMPPDGPAAWMLRAASGGMLEPTSWVPPPPRMMATSGDPPAPSVWRSPSAIDRKPISTATTRATERTMESEIAVRRGRLASEALVRTSIWRGREDMGSPRLQGVGDGNAHGLCRGYDARDEPESEEDENGLREHQRRQGKAEFGAEEERACLGEG